MTNEAVSATPEQRVSRGEWSNAEAYEKYIGRWSRPVAREFVSWLRPTDNARWLDVGCGTGALSEAILKWAKGARVTALDRSASYMAYAVRLLAGQNIEFREGDALALDLPDESFDFTVSGLMLNFVADAHLAVTQMARVTRRGGTVGAYIWDYAQGMEFLRAIWKIAFVLDPNAINHDEGHLSPLCGTEPMANLFKNAGLANVEARPFVIETKFPNFDAYWEPFLGGQGTVARYVMSLSPQRRAELQDGVRKSLTYAEDGSISFNARAWAVRGNRK
ncbi:MAG: class I SAM-dependent methyltransferase [Sulfurifustaceae bacterium]